MSDSKENRNKISLIEIERQVERSGFFTHSSFSNQAERINEIESFLYGLIDSLIEKRILDKGEFEETVKMVRDEILTKKEHLHAGIAISVDGNDKEANYPPINCEERIHLCKAACCRLHFALTVNEIENGKAKWDLGQPYFIRQSKDGYCTHIHGGKHQCTIYNDRPKICRKYTCADDKRIWTDFEKMELNSDWLDTNLGERKLKMQEIYMLPEEKIIYKPKSID